jgi:hypothetical protein
MGKDEDGLISIHDEVDWLVAAVGVAPHPPRRGGDRGLAAKAKWCRGIGTRQWHGPGRHLPDIH